MRRPPLSLIAALLASAVGLLIGDSHRTLTLALPTTFVLLALFKKFIDADTIPIELKAALLTGLLWIPAFALFLYLLAPLGGGSCEPDFAYAEAERMEVAGAGTPLTAPAALVFDVRPAVETNGSCVGVNGGKPQAVINAGVLNDKAVSKPVPLYPLIAKSACVKGTVVVSVVVDADNGQVIWANVISGHPLLRQAARAAACRAQFAPLVCGPPLRVSGVLTYNFGVEQPKSSATSSNLLSAVRE